MRLYLIACEVMFRELSYASALAPHTVDVCFMQKGLHDEPTTMRAALQEKIDAVDPAVHDAIVLGYALCSNGIVGVRAPERIPLIVPRAHDCITFFIGSKDGYARRFRAKPGTYYYTAGWIERDIAHVPWKPGGSEADQQKLAQYLEKYGEDNGRFLFEFENRWQAHYTTAAYIKMRLADRPELAEAAQRSAEEYGWEYEEIEGDERLFHAMLAGEWGEEEFLIVPPGSAIAASADDRVVRCSRSVEG
jgi:hypothetical protein